MNKIALLFASTAFASITTGTVLTVQALGMNPGPERVWKADTALNYGIVGMALVSATGLSLASRRRA